MIRLYRFSNTASTPFVHRYEAPADQFLGWEHPRVMLENFGTLTLFGSYCWEITLRKPPKGRDAYPMTRRPVFPIDWEDRRKYWVEWSFKLEDVVEFKMVKKIVDNPDLKIHLWRVDNAAGK